MPSKESRNQKAGLCLQQNTCITSGLQNVIMHVYDDNSAASLRE